eukprot:786168-Pleurochrysis_carterae.AAC.1
MQPAALSCRTTSQRKTVPRRNPGHLPSLVRRLLSTHRTSWAGLSASLKALFRGVLSPQLGRLPRPCPRASPAPHHT